MILNVKATKEQVSELRNQFGQAGIRTDERFSASDVNLIVAEDIADDVIENLDELGIEHEYMGTEAE